MANSASFPLATVALAILVRWLVGQFPYSGHKSAPMFGDYEAQRHWMEVTTNLPVSQWYTNSTNNDLQYWGLDYPPLTAYHMWLLGKASELTNSSWTELHKSRGFESVGHKLFMRSTVIISELITYIPIVIYYFYKTQPIQYTTPPSQVHKQNVAIYCALLLFYPAQILIDHGHFQYNSVFLGLTLMAVTFITQGRQYSAAIAFTLALGYKQMSLYYALPFFWYIASKNLRVRPLWKGLRNIILVGLLVMTVMALYFAPYLHSVESVGQVLRRIFPFNRGLFEDKVANFWFSLSIFYKYRNFYTIDELLKASTLFTLLFSLPAGLHLLFSPSIRTFKYSLVTTSMVFFLFSFQVHEKTILVPALPLLLLSREHPLVANWFIIVSTFSLHPLLLKDGQLVPYLVLMVIFTLMSMEIFHGLLAFSRSRIFSLQNLMVVSYLTSVLGCLVLNLSASFIKPPVRYPHIHPTLNALYSFIHFMGFLLFFYFKQFRGDQKRNASTDKIYLIKKTK